MAPEILNIVFFLVRHILNMSAMLRLRLDRDDKGAPFGLIQFKELGIARGCCHLTEAAPFLFRSFGPLGFVQQFPGFTKPRTRDLLLVSRGEEQRLVSDLIFPTELP